MQDSYFTISSVAEALFKDKNSKFYAYCFPINTESQFKSILGNLKKQHPKAGHFCYAYKIGTSGNLSKSNDDGEPAGSAGKPILNVINSKNLSDVLVIVVRYFGGTLLGVPGLINAYKQATIECLNSATVIEKLLESKVKISFPYERTNIVMMNLKKLNVQNFTQEYENQNVISFNLRFSDLEKLKSLFQNTWYISLEIGL